MATMNQLAACQRESKVLSERLSVAEDELQAKAAELAREQAYKEAAEAKVAQLTQVKSLIYLCRVWICSAC